MGVTGHPLGLLMEVSLFRADFLSMPPHEVLLTPALHGSWFGKVVMRPDPGAGTPGFKSPALPTTRCGSVGT